MKPRFKYLKTAVMVLLSSVFILANNQAIAKENPWLKVSEGTATWLFFDIYKANLYVDKSTRKFLPENFLDDSQPLKLKLCYLKEITSDIFIKGANKVLPKNISPQLKEEVERLHKAYKSVKTGDCYTLKYTLQEGTTLLLNDVPIFNSTETGFKALYFGIWLGKTPLSDDLKARLVRR